MLELLCCQSLASGWASSNGTKYSSSNKCASGPRSMRPLKRGRRIQSRFWIRPGCPGWLLMARSFRCRAWWWTPHRFGARWPGGSFSAFESSDAFYDGSGQLVLSTGALIPGRAASQYVVIGCCHYLEDLRLVPLFNGQSSRVSSGGCAVVWGRLYVLGGV